jgi:hypothetical protein
MRCCCCLLLHAMTRAARGSSHLVWDAQTSVWALATFRTFSVSDDDVDDDDNDDDDVRLTPLTPSTTGPWLASTVEPYWRDLD